MQVPSQLGPFRLVRELSRGGMGAVFEAEHQQTGGRYALKIILSDRLGCADDELLARFRRESEALGGLNHPHVVHVHAADLDGPVPYLVQDLLTGGTLQERLKAEPLPVEEAVRVVGKLAAGLAAAHAQGILHRDLKPDNVLFDEHGEPRLVDFGLTRDQASTERLTKTGDLLGTPAYMSPEQARGEGGIDTRSDVYGLGAVLYAALTGRPPVQAGSVMATLVAVVQKPVTALSALRPDVPPAVEAACLRALSKQPAARYATVLEFAEALSAAVAAPAATGRSRARLGALALSALVALCLGIAVQQRAGEPSRPPAPLTRVEPAKDPLVVARAAAESALSEGDGGAALAAVDSALAVGLAPRDERELRGLAHLLEGDLSEAQVALKGLSAYAAVSVERDRLALLEDAAIGIARPEEQLIGVFHAADRLTESARILGGVPHVGALLTARVQESVAVGILLAGSSYPREREVAVLDLLQRTAALNGGPGAGAALAARANLLHEFSKRRRTENEPLPQVQEWADVALANPGLTPRWRALASTLRMLHLPGQPLLEAEDMLTVAPEGLTRIEVHLYALAYRVFAHRWYRQLMDALARRDAARAAAAWRKALALTELSGPHTKRSSSTQSRDIMFLNTATLHLLALQSEAASAALAHSFSPRFRYEAVRLRFEVRLLTRQGLGSVEKRLNDILREGLQAKDPRWWCLRAAVRLGREQVGNAQLDLHVQAGIQDPLLPFGTIYPSLWRTPEETLIEGRREPGLRVFLAEALRDH